MTDDHNSLLYWYPKIRGKVPTPWTAAVLLPPLLGGHAMGYAGWIDRGVPKGFMKELKKAVAVLRLSYPVFIRTDQMAAKHEWKDTCFVESENVLEGHVRNLIEHNVMVDMDGSLLPKAIVVREFLKLKTCFTAYRGMPVAREFRFFAKAGKISCFHPYWPHAALEEGRPSAADWRHFLSELEEEPDRGARLIVKRASAEFDEQMSADVCELADGGWMLTDMALGKDSFHWKHDSKDGGGREGEE